ncbi:hypothetical protein E7T09_04490 [Deinococcus sp. KSM4-11]|uniref:hypothetical protein n=1 Tax=Deinococcus sp. KSM4-11 TaxID=2568654 RepID=UPI0010A582EB|nr:hypothetical protein [Deinococcus sp. KSM4-11]THF88469.1 hypothetical protein E7T09_04490 [Deinococcus sp. KSM4-11]
MSPSANGLAHGLPFLPLAQAMRLTLTPEKFTPGQQVLGILSTVAYFDGPLGHLLLFKGGENFRFFLKGRAEFVVPGGTAAGAYVVNLAGAGHSPIRTTRPAAAFPTTSHPDLLAYTSIDNKATWQLASISAADFAAGTVTVTLPANTTHVVVYHTTGNGEFELRILRPLGSDTSRAKLFGSALRSIHETDQSNTRSAPTFGGEGREYPLPPQFRLELAARTTTPIVFDQYAQHELSLPVFDTPVRVLDAAQLNAQAELKLRGGTL